MEEILSQINFGEGMALPVANEENKAFEAQIEKKQKQIEQVREEVDRSNERIHSMKNHLKNVKQERLQIQELCNAREREIKTEEHLKLIAEREEGRLHAEVQRLEAELNEINNKKNIYENNIFKNMSKLDQIKEQMSWDQQALDAWMGESAKQDEDSMILLKYAKDDEGKIKQLSLAQEKLIEKCLQKRKLLEQEITRTLTSQLELDKISEAYREAHKVRKKLLHQWEESIQQMQKRDLEIDNASLQLMELKIELKNKKSILNERQKFLDNELNNNKEKEKKISASERQAAVLRLTYQDMEIKRLEFLDELETLKYSVDKIGRDVNNARKAEMELKKEIFANKEKFKQSQTKSQEVHEQYKSAQNMQLTAEERTQMLKSCLTKEEILNKDIEKELSQLRDIQFKKTQELYQLTQVEANLNADIQGAKAASRNLSSKLNKLDMDSLKQQEIVHNQDFHLQQLERHLTRINGDRSSEERQHLEKQIKELSDILESYQAKHSILTIQLKKLSDDLRRANRDFIKIVEEDNSLDVKIGELTLHNESSELELKKLIKCKEELMVEKNILKLDIKRLREQLHNKTNEVLTLEDFRLMLDASMKERCQDIYTSNDILKAQIKFEEEDRKKISCELHECISKIEILRKRYEILTVSIIPPDGEENSQAYYVIKAAQEKEELQKTGDELDAKVRKAEKEIRALENTLQLINNRNESFRQCFSTIKETSMEYEEKLALEEQHRVSMDKCQYKQRQIKELQHDLHTMNDTCEKLTAELNKLFIDYSHTENEKNGLQKELELQDEKKDRATKIIKKFKSSINNAISHEERDIAVRELREVNKNITKEILEVAHNYPDILPIVYMYFHNAGIIINSSNMGSRPSSIRSGKSSLSVRSISTISYSRSETSNSRKHSREILSTSSLDLFNSFTGTNLGVNSEAGNSSKSLKKLVSKNTSPSKEFEKNK
ncbi:coiled-coil domain-containing protein 39 isoform X2 [Hydra vulgaris]